LLEHGPRALGRLALGGGRAQYQRAVLRADVVSLPHALGRVVVLPEEAQDLVVAGLRGVEDDEDDLGVARPTGAGLLVGRVRREAARIAHRGRIDAGRLPEDALLFLLIGQPLL